MVSNRDAIFEDILKFQKGSLLIIHVEIVYLLLSELETDVKKAKATTRRKNIIIFFAFLPIVILKSSFIDK